MRQLDFPKITLRCHGELAKRRLSAFTSFSLPFWVEKGGSATLRAVAGYVRKAVRKAAERFRQRCSGVVAAPNGEKLL
ncbi:MAG: hypothetical protein DMF12_00455 [Verrucomicrobia bacterium]|nr:MAG: hypothetical protein AUI05_04485 [Verrucomicrobia bacterium 13_2_20CM_2_54_15_9cls]PYI44241.1 MAG: hypothetical protein DMF12_00455 [Verrucomicrobiota bacterium]